MTLSDPCQGYHGNAEIYHDVDEGRGGDGDVLLQWLYRLTYHGRDAHAVKPGASGTPGIFLLTPMQ